MAMNNKDKFSFIVKKDKKSNGNQIQQKKSNSEGNDELKGTNYYIREPNHFMSDCHTNDNPFKHHMKSINPFVTDSRLNEASAGSAITPKEEMTSFKKSNENSIDQDQQQINTNISEKTDSDSVKSTPNQGESNNFGFIKNSSIKEKENDITSNTQKKYNNYSFLNSLETFEMNQQNSQNIRIMSCETDKRNEAIKSSSSKEIKRFVRSNNNHEDCFKETTQETVLKQKLPDEEGKEKFEIQTNCNIESFLAFVTNLYLIKLDLATKESELQSHLQNHEKLFKEQNEAIETNNFTQADIIETKIKQVASLIELLRTSIKEKNKDLIQAKQEEFTLIHQHSSNLKDISTSYSHLKSILEKDIEAFLAKEMQDHAKENKRLNKLQEKLFFIKGNIEAEDNYIKEEEAKLDSVIRSQASNIFNDLENYNQIKETLTNEINELRRVLKQTEAELLQVSNNIQIKENDINVIKANYSQEFSKISIKKRNFKENEKDYEEQEQNYQLKYNLYQKRDIEYHNKLTAMKNTIQNYQNAIELINEGISKQSEALGLKETLVNREIELFEEINTITNAIETKQKIIKEQSNDNQQLRVIIKVFESEIKQIEIKIPPLEEEKKTFVKGKKFKEAGRVSNELKALIEEKNVKEKAIEESEIKIKNNEDYIHEVSSEISLLFNNKADKEKELNNVRYNYFVQFLNTIYDYQKKGAKSKDIKNIINYIQKEIDLSKKDNEYLHE